jgi:hypothetical protein
LAFTGILIEGVFLGQVEQAYVQFVDTLAGGGINTVDDIYEGLWAGYHPIPLLFSRLRWYGQLGQYHYTDAETAACSKALAGEIEIAQTFCKALPASWGDQDGYDVFGQVLLAAEARLALDSGQAMTVDQVATLAGMEKRSVQNALSRKGEAGLQANPDGMVTHGEAMRWLEARRNFIKTTTYRSDDDLGTENDESNATNTVREYTFVPVTDDGAAFLPELKRSAGYQIGKYGEEIYVEDYFEALKQLQAMDTPRFRRPNANGIPGIKVGTGWQRVALDDLDAAIARMAA